MAGKVINAKPRSKSKLTQLSPPESSNRATIRSFFVSLSLLDRIISACN